MKKFNPFIEANNNNAKTIIEQLENLTIYKNRAEEKYEPVDVADYIEDWKKNRCSD